MKTLRLSNKRWQQFAISILLVALMSMVGMFLNPFVGHRVIAFLLLVTVSILAMFLDIWPVLAAAILSALCWDFLFIPPRFTFTVGTPDDQLLLLTYFIIALINAVLTSKIRERDKALQQQKEQEKSARFYNTLLNSLSHELRTPITTILGSTDNLLENAKQLTDEDKIVLLREISTASIRLNQQVENLLNMSRLEAGAFTIKKDWVDLNDLIYKVVHRLDTHLAHHRLQIVVPEEFPLFKMDYGLTEQVVYNLLLNASQHTPDGTEIKVSASEGENGLYLRIEDNGQGFPEEELTRVFEKFYRVQGSAPGGTGLGLSIVKGLVEAQQGTIQLQNLDKGCRFTIHLPAEKAIVQP